MTVICKGETVAADSPAGKYLKDDGSWSTPAGGMTYVNRGDPSDWDFTVSNFTRDDTWRDLDLSSIVPAGAVAVTLSCVIKANATGKYVIFRKKGNTNLVNVLREETLVANLDHYFMGIVFCDTNRIIQYRVISTAVGTLNVCVGGWFI